MEAKEEIYQYIRKNIKEDGVTAQSIAEIFGIKRNVASHYLNLLEKEGKLQKGTNRPVHFSIPTDTEKKAEECNNMIDERPAAQKEVSVFSKFIGYNGSMQNLFLGMVVLVVTLVLKHFTNPKGILSTASILIGILVGYVVAVIMTMVLPHTGTAVLEDGSTVSYTYSWVVNFQQVKDASWFALPGIAGLGKLAEVKPVFRLEAILPVAIMFIVTTVETVGDICACVESGMDREATDSELSGGIICDGLGSSFAAALGVLPNTSFAQNVGIISMTKIVNRMALSCGAVFLILCGLCPKIAAFVSIMPQSVLGGAAVMMFASILVSGIQLITKEPITSREITIVSVALGLGYGLGSTAGATSELPYYIQLIFGGSGIVPAAVAAIVLNIIIPKEKKKAE